MDIRANKQPLAINGVHWSEANRWIIGTPSQVSIVTPRCNLRGEILSANTVSVRIETSQDIEAVCLLDSLPSGFHYEYAVVLLASDSSIRIFAPKGLPDTTDWDEVGRGAFGTGADHVCAIASTQAIDRSGNAIPMVSCASIGGEITVLGLACTDTNHIEANRVLKFRSGHELISYVTWTANGATGIADCQPLLAACAVDGTANLWNITQDLSSANMICTLGEKDWRPVTSSESCPGLLVLAKLGTVIVVDTSNQSSAGPAVSSGGFVVEYIDIGITQTITSCVVDEKRERIYVGTMEFAIFVLKRSRQDRRKWERAGKDEEEALREGMRKTVIRSFTTKFSMGKLHLRSMHMSPNSRYLMFVADDQVNWGLVKDGLGVTRIHFHPLEEWTMEAARACLYKVVNGEYQGDLQYNVWDIFHDIAADEAVGLVKHLDQMTLQRGSDAYQQRLFVLNLVKQLEEVAGRARNAALDYHVKKLFKRIKELVNGSKNGTLS
ncbi:hypothetical protein EV175_002385, partial [Coemansia sp. RSA 1933]